MNLTVIGLAAVIVLQATGQTPRGGQIRGITVDPAGFELRRVYIRVLQPDSNAIAGRASTGDTGNFQIAGLIPGSYNLRLWLSGFRARVVGPVLVRDGEITDVGKIPLDIACEGPGVHCFDIGPPEEPVVASGYLEVKLECGVDLDTGAIDCPDAPLPSHQEKASDFLIKLVSSGVSLTPLNGAVVSAPELVSSHCRGPKMSDAPFRVDGLGPGIAFCVRTRQGHLSHVFFMSDVEPTSAGIRLWYSTLAR